MLCNNFSPPKCTFITWLTILDRLATCDRLQKFGIVCDQLCVLCGNVDETRDHLFFVCEFSYEIWSSLLCWLGIQRTAGDWQGVLQSAHCQSNSSASCIFRMCISIAVYFIWRERNARKFQQVKMKPDEIVRKIKTVIYSRCFQVRKLACKVP